LLAVAAGFPARSQSRPWGLWGDIWASAFNEWTLESPTSVSVPGTYTLQIQPAVAPVISGGFSFQPLATNAPLLIDKGASQEVVVPSEVVCSWTPGNCSVTVTLAQPHRAPFELRSGSAGLQEAINFSGATGGTIVLDPQWQGTSTMITAAAGNSKVVIEDRRAGQVSWYAWNGSAYAPVLAASGGGVGFEAISAAEIEQVVNADQACASPGVFDQTCIAGAVAILAGQPGTVRLPARHTYAISANVLLPANAALEVDRGALLQIAAGATLTVNGPLQAGAYPIFSGPGAVAFSPTAPVPRAYPEWWGAVCDAITDDTAAMQAALDRVGVVPLFLPPGADCRVSAPLQFHDFLTLEGAGARNSRSVISWWLSLPLNATESLLGPAAGQLAASVALRGVMLDASNVHAAGSTSNVAILDFLNANEASLDQVQLFGPVANPNTWAGGYVYGLYVHSAPGGSSFYGNVRNSIFSQLTNDEVLAGQSGNQVNAWHHENDIYLDSPASGQTSGVNVDATYAASDFWTGCTFSNGADAFVLHGQNVSGFGLVDNYVDGGEPAPFISAPDYGANATAHNIAHLFSNSGLAAAGISLPAGSFSYAGGDGFQPAVALTIFNGTAGSATCGESLIGVLKISTCYLNGYGESGTAQQFAFPAPFHASPVLQEGGGSCGTYHASADSAHLTLPANSAMTPETCNIVAIGQ